MPKLPTLPSINWAGAAMIVVVGALAFFAYDLSQGAYDKTKLAAAGWTAKV